MHLGIQGVYLPEGVWLLATTSFQSDSANPPFELLGAQVAS